MIFKEDDFLEWDFETPDIVGTWLAFNGNREAFRAGVCAFGERVLGPEHKGIHLQFSDLGAPRFSLNSARGNVKMRNLSYAHTESWGCIILSKNDALQVGVDIELLERRFEKDRARQIIERYGPVRVKHQSFIEFWVEREAYAKATGLGLVRSQAGWVPLCGRKPKESPVAFYPLPKCPAGVVGAWVSTQVD